MTYETMRPMLDWRVSVLGRVTPEALVEAMTVEGLPYEQIPADRYPAVVGFRKRTATARLAVARRYCAEQDGK